MKIQTQILRWHSPYTAEVRVTDGKKIVHYEINSERAKILYCDRSRILAIHKLAKEKFKNDDMKNRMIIMNTRIFYL